MKLIDQEQQLRHELANLRNERIALVPTMGCLHDGHISLIRKAKKLADIVVVSIYVNPLQFGQKDDLIHYPRTLAEDISKCREEGVAILFHPENLYATGRPSVSLHVDKLDQCLCGIARPGHFDGVVTVVNILLNLVQPDLALFGEKDWQQLTIITRMIHDLHMPVTIVQSSTLREDNGLAMSSRNRHLDSKQRNSAAALFQALKTIQQQLLLGQHDSTILESRALASLQHAGIEVEYLEIRDESSLQRLQNAASPGARAFIAATIGNTRLIDNYSMSEVSHAT